jgi:hypothetical protein
LFFDQFLVGKGQELTATAGVAASTFLWVTKPWWQGVIWRKKGNFWCFYPASDHFGSLWRPRLDRGGAKMADGVVTFWCGKQPQHSGREGRGSGQWPGWKAWQPIPSPPAPLVLLA